MIIKRLTLKNFGVYAGTNTFSFTSDKPIVLIGGMNGCGKTTFLEAVLLALYGSNSSAYLESKKKTYGQYLKAMVNRNHVDEECSVELEFEICGDKSEVYVIRREWTAQSKIIKEELRVYKDGKYNEFLTGNWSMFVENILPSALSSFFFFDGEKIAELAIDSSNTQLKNAIRSMLGISVLDVLNSDLVRNLKKAEKRGLKSKTAEEVQKLREVKENAEKVLDEIDASIDALQQKLGKDQEVLDSLHIQYAAKGGNAVSHRNELLHEKSTLTAQLGIAESKICDLAAAELPLLLVADLVGEIKLEAQDEHMESVLSEALSWMDGFYEEFVHQNGDSSAGSKAFVDFFRGKVDGFQGDSFYNLSDQALLQVNNLVETVMESVSAEAEELLAQKKEIKMKIDEIEGFLTLDINEKELEEIQQKIREIDQLLVEDKVRESELARKRSEANAKVISSTLEFNRYVEAYLSDEEQMDTIERTIKYSNIAMNIINRYTAELQKRKTGVLAETITDCYQKLASKKSMIQQIFMDPKTLNLTYFAEDGSEVPRDSLSAGEKQLMVVSVLWALAICSKKKLPTIIDTPLSRLDSTHRTAMITTYFPNAGEQTIILSTDSEIDAGYYELMKDNVGDEYTLNYDEISKSTSIEKGYLIGERA